MKRATIPVATVAFLLLGGVALHIPGAAPAVAQTGGPGPATRWYTVEQGMASGGGYYLTSLTWRVSGAVSGGDYSLTDAGQDGPWGNCCCTYLPVILRNFQ